MACAGTQYTVPQMLQMARQAGYTDAGAVEIVAHALVESGGCDRALNASSGAAGILQFIPSTSSRIGLSNPYDAQASFTASYKLTKGTNFSDWTPYEPANAYAGALARVRGESGTPVSGNSTGLVSDGGIGASITGAVGNTTGTLKGIGQHFVDYSTMLVGVLVIGVGVAVLGYLFLTKTDTGRGVVKVGKDALMVVALK